MIINLRQLKKLPVYTESGIKLGKVVDVNFLVDTQSVYQYIIQPNFFGRIILVGSNQVIEINDEKMIVEDAVAPEILKAKKNFISDKILGGVATSGIDSK